MITDRTADSLDCLWRLAKRPISVEAAAFAKIILQQSDANPRS
jgi:hypothetical protein